MSMFGSQPPSALLNLILGQQPPINALGRLMSLPQDGIPPSAQNVAGIAQPANALGVLSQFLAPVTAATPVAQNALAPNKSTLLSDAEKQYPFIKQYNPVVTFSPGQGDGDYAETWFPGDPGDNSRKRPSSIPMNNVGVEVYRPSDFGATDLAAEFLHVDPYANSVRQSLLQSLSPQQIAQLKRESNDYADSLKYGDSQQKALQNAVDSAMRGYTVGQWPADANARMQYTPQQLKMLNALKAYMQTGKRQ